MENNDYIYIKFNRVLDFSHNGTKGWPVKPDIIRLSTDITDVEINHMDKKYCTVEFRTENDDVWEYDVPNEDVEKFFDQVLEALNSLCTRSKSNDYPNQTAND